jgi:hypothetical protein
VPGVEAPEPPLLDPLLLLLELPELPPELLLLLELLVPPELELPELVEPDPEELDPEELEAAAPEDPVPVPGLTVSEPPPPQALSSRARVPAAMQAGTALNRHSGIMTFVQPTQRC